MEIPSDKPKKARPLTKPQTVPKLESFTGPLFFDLETIPDFGRQNLFGLPEPEEYVAVDPTEGYEHILKMAIPAMESYLASVSPSREWLDGLMNAEQGSAKPRGGAIDKVNAAISRITAGEAIIASNNKTMATTPEMCRIVSMGYACGVDQPVQSLTLQYGETIKESVREIDILELFWTLAARCKGPVCGYNIVGFDLPVIFARSIILGVKPTRGFDMKPWGADAIDLMVKRYPRGSGKLKDLARLYGIPVPAGDVDGGAVLELFQLNHLSKIDYYVRSDVKITRDIYELFYGFFV